MKRDSIRLLRNMFAGAAAGLTMNIGASAIGPEVIYTKIATHPTSLVPGALDSGGSPVVTNFRALEDLHLSSDGSRWIILGRTQQGSDNEVILLIGSGDSGTMMLQEGRPVPDGVAGELVDFVPSNRLRFDDSNRIAFTVRAKGGSSTIFQKVMVYTGGLTPTASDFHIVGQGGNTPASGGLYTGLADAAPNPVGDERIGNSIGSIHILNNGVIGAQDNSILNISSTRRPAIFYSSAFQSFGASVTFNKFKQVGVDTFLSLDGTVNSTYASAAGGLGSGSFFTTPDGAHWLVHGQILGAPTTADSVLVYDGRARLQEDFAIGASSAIVNSIVNTELLPTGDYYSRGTRKASPGGAQNGVWAVRNGVLFAQTGDPVASPVVGPVEHWASSFLAFTGNTNGDTVLVGKTDNPNAAIDDVVVVNGEVVLREGDPIDLNNNGQYDDNVFIGRGNNTLGAFEVEDVALANDGMLYIFVDLRDGQGNDLGTIPPFGTPQAFVRLDTSPECVGDANDNGVVDIDDLVLVITNWAQATQTINISMQDFEFSPSSVNAHAGDTLQFNWVSGTHTATSGTGCVGDGLFDFPITRGTPTAQYVIPQSFSGNLGFFCTPHCAFGMTGEATVSSFGADVDGNGVVDIDDLVLVITHWGACP